MTHEAHNINVVIIIIELQRNDGIPASTRPIGAAMTSKQWRASRMAELMVVEPQTTRIALIERKKSKADSAILHFDAASRKTGVSGAAGTGTAVLVASSSSAVRILQQKQK